jgi:hypothetical protein
MTWRCSPSGIRLCRGSGPRVRVGVCIMAVCCCSPFELLLCMVYLSEILFFVVQYFDDLTIGGVWNLMAACAGEFPDHARGWNG